MAKNNKQVKKREGNGEGATRKKPLELQKTKPAQERPEALPKASSVDGDDNLKNTNAKKSDATVAFNVVKQSNTERSKKDKDAVVKTEETRKDNSQALSGKTKADDGQTAQGKTDTKPDNINSTDNAKSRKTKPEWDELAKPQPPLEVNWYNNNPDAKAASVQAIKRLENRRNQREAPKVQKPVKKKSLFKQIADNRKKRRTQVKRKLAKQAEASYRLEYSNRLKSSLAAKAMQITHPKPNRRGRWFVVFLALLLLLVLIGVGKMIYDGFLANKSSQKKATQTTLTTNQQTEEKAMNLDIPYNKTIGFVGDSLTYGCCQTATPAPTDEVKLLGSGYRAINRGVNGSTTQDWQKKLLAPAIDEFRDNDVEVVQIMLGTNDSAHTDLSIDDIIGYYRDIIGRLEGAGVKIIIVNKVPFSPQHDDERINRINIALNQLVDGDRVFLGDDKSYEYFRQHLELFVDGTHFNEQGYKELAKLWATAFKRVLVEPDGIKRTLSSDKYKLGSNDKFSYTVTKPSAWLMIGGGYGGVYMDGRRLASNDYLIRGDSAKTKVELQNDYLNSLPVGEHELEVRFSDGITFSSRFEVTK